MTESRALIVVAAVLLLAAAVPASAAEICVGPGGLDFIFHLDPASSSTSVGTVITVAGLLRSTAGATITLDPVTGTAIVEDPGHLRIDLLRTGASGNTIYNARLTGVPGFAGGFFWVGHAKVNRLPEGTTLFPQTTIELDIVDCATGAIRMF